MEQPTPDEITRRARDLIKRGIEPGVAEMFKEKFGGNWVAELNSRRDADGKKKSGVRSFGVRKDGMPNWDPSGILNSIVHYADRWGTISNRNDKKFRIDDLQSAARSLVRTRNSDEHIAEHSGRSEDPYYTAVAFFTNALTLLEAFDAESVWIEKLLELRSLLVAPEHRKTPLEDGKGAARGESSQRKENEFDSRVVGDVDSGNALGKNEDVRGQRTSPLPQPASGVVLFPIVNDGKLSEESNFGSVVCVLSKSTLRQDCATVSGLVPAQRNVYYEAISNARHGERDPVCMNAYTQAWIEPGDFSGASFGLAAAIADRAVRYELLPEFQTRHVIATGKIGRGGKVEKIDSFISKLKLIERDLAVLMDLSPDGLVLVFPKANLDMAAKDLLRRLSGLCRLKWLAIDDLAELNDWFVGDQKKVTSQIKHQAASPAAMPMHDGKSRSPAAPVPVSRSAFRWWHGAAAGLVVLAALYAAAVYDTQDKQNPVARDQAKTAVTMLSSLGSATRANPQDWMACSELTARSGLLTDTTLALFPSEHRQASADLQQCAYRTADSDRRLNELRAASAALDPNLPGTVDRLAAARKAITVFDDGRLSDDDRNRLVAAGDRAQMRLADSDRRIAPLMSAHIAWRSSGNALTLRALAASSRGLSDFDRARTVPGLREALNDVDHATRELEASTARWGALQGAIDRANRDPIEFYWQPLRNALSQISSLDRELASQPQRQLLTQAQGLLTAPQPSSSPVPNPVPRDRRKLDDFGTIPSGR